MTSVVAFTVDDIHLAVAATQVQELLRAVLVTPLPGAPRDVIGAIDLRGQVIAVVDLAPRLGRPLRGVRITDHFLICAAGNATLAIRADRVDELTSIEPSELADAPADAEPWVRVLARKPDGLILICDLERLLADGDFEQLARALAKARA